ncbi:hypothetical protein D6D27_05451 [Aureobasidium pullulans]|nr:hypothetical protein D6D27_05451 [Aureobasidium pullulans]
MATKLAFPGFEKENSATFTVDNVTHQFTQDHKGLTRGFIFAYMGLSRMQINTCDRAIRAAIMADSTLAPPGNLEETVKFAWDKHNEAVHEARYKLQSSLLNGGSAVECSGLFQQRNNQSGRPEWYREDWLYTQASDDPGFLSSMLQQLLLMEVARIRREAKRDFDKEVKAAGTAALARGSGKRPITSTAAALIAGQPGQGRGRASSSTRSRGASRARSSNRRSMSSARNSTSGLSDGAGDMHLEEASDTEMMDVKKELKDQLVVFVWVNVLDPEAGQATLISSAPVRLDSFFNGSEGLTSMTDLAGFRYELKRSCLRKPRLALADLHAGLYSTRSDSFWPLKLVDEEVDAEDQEFEARAVKKQFAGLFQQFWQEATSTIEVIQVFVAAERAHFELIPKDECSLNRGIPDTRELNFTTKSEASEFDSQNSPLGPPQSKRRRGLRPWDTPGLTSNKDEPLKPPSELADDDSEFPGSSFNSGENGDGYFESGSETRDGGDESPKKPVDPDELARDAADLARRQSMMAGQEEKEDREQGDGITGDGAATSTTNTRPRRWINRPPRPPRKSPSLLPSIHEAVKDMDIKLCAHLSSGLVGDDAVDKGEAVVQKVKTLEEVQTAYANYEHRSPALWDALGTFYGADVTDLSPSSGITMPGWKKSLYILAYQMYSAGWVLHRLLTGNPFCIIAHDMGLGKTAVAIAVVWTSALMIKKTHLSPAVEPGYLDPTVLTNLEPEMGDKEPRLQEGPTLVVSTPKLTQVWVQEIRQFLGSRVSIVLAGSKSLTAEAKAFFIGQHNCFEMSTEIVETSKWYPTPEQLDERYTSKGLKIPKPFLVTDLLMRNRVQNPGMPPGPHEDDTEETVQAREKWHKNNPAWVFEGPPPWHNGCSTWMVFTTPECVKRNIYQEHTAFYMRVGDDSNKKPINSAFRLVIVDEFHEHVGLTKEVWFCLANIPENPQYIYISGTPFNKMHSLVAPVIAAEAQYLEVNPEAFKVPLKDVARWIQSALESRARDSEQRLAATQLNAWGREQRPAIRKKIRVNGFQKIRTLTRQVDVEWAKVNKALKGELGKRGEDSDGMTGLDVSVLGPGQLEAIGSLGKLFAEDTIKFGVDYRHLPNAETCGPNEGAFAAPMAPHKTFEVNVGIPEAEMEYLMPLWDECIQNATIKSTSKDGKFNMKAFATHMNEMRVNVSLPCLPRLKEENPALAEELPDYLVKTANALLKDPRSTELYQHMNEINKCPLFVGLRRFLNAIRAQKNFTGKHPRKVVIVAFVPFLITVANIWMMWKLDQEKNDAEGSDDLTAFSDFEKDIVFVNAQTKDKAACFDLFKGTGDDVYADQPGCLMATATQVDSGLSLTPADVVIALDTGWIIQMLIQISGRVRRAEMSQKAPFTEMFIQNIVNTYWETTELQDTPNEQSNRAVEAYQDGNAQHDAAPIQPTLSSRTESGPQQHTRSFKATVTQEEEGDDELEEYIGFEANEDHNPTGSFTDWAEIVSAIQTIPAALASEDGDDDMSIDESLAQALDADGSQDFPGNTSETVSHTGSATIRPTSGRLSSTAATEVREAFKDQFGHGAGVPLRRCPTQDTTEATLLNGFNGKFDFSFARWIHRENISKNGIERLLKHPGIDDLRNMLSWKSAEELRRKMENIPTMADIGPWVSKSITVPSETSATGSATYQIRYRDPMRAVRFFLGHARFRDDLCYAPYRAWSDKEHTCRRYTDMPSGDWWWNMQETLNQEPETAGATIVPLITALSSQADESSESSGSDSELDPDKRVHDIKCFAFNHRYMEINQSMMVDILHQLLKGVMMHVFAWTNAFIADQAQNKKGTRMGQGVEAASKGATRHRRKADKSKVAKGIVEAIVDRRFASIPPYPTLRVFSHMSSVTEWTGAEQKSILRQILPVFVPLLEEIGTEDAKEAIRFLRATVDFITLAMYESHDTETLRYFDLALCRMNQHKEVFRKYRNPKAEEDDRHFNFPT